MSDKSSSEERGNNFSIDPIIAAAFLEIYQQLDILKRDIIFERTGREILESQLEEIMETNSRNVIEIETLKRTLNQARIQIWEPTKEGLKGRGPTWEEEMARKR